MYEYGNAILLLLKYGCFLEIIGRIIVLIFTVEKSLNSSDYLYYNTILTGKPCTTQTYLNEFIVTHKLTLMSL